jgi:hypothetical protein
LDELMDGILWDGNEVDDEEVVEEDASRAAGELHERSCWRCALLETDASES